MSKDDIIQSVIEDDNYRRLCNRIDSGGDLYQNFIVFLLEMDEDRLQAMYANPGFRYFMVRVITQPHGFRCKDLEWIKRRSSISNDLPDEVFESPMDLILELTEKAIEALPKTDSGFSYEKELLKLHMEEPSLLAISRLTGISYKSILASINGTKEVIRTKVQNTSGCTA